METAIKQLSAKQRTYTNYIFSCNDMIHCISYITMFYATCSLIAVNFKITDYSIKVTIVLKIVTL